MHFLRDFKNSAPRNRRNARQHYARERTSSPVELSALNVDTILSNSHTEVLHG